MTPYEIQLTYNGPWFLCLAYAEPPVAKETQVYRDGSYRKVKPHAVRLPQPDK